MRTSVTKTKEAREACPQGCKMSQPHFHFVTTESFTELVSDLNQETRQVMREGFPLQELSNVQTLTPKPNSFTQNCAPNLVLVQRGTRQGGFPKLSTHTKQSIPATGAGDEFPCP